MKGKLYLVATPIGNLEDITLRAIRVLKDVDIIYAEDTRQTLKLLNHLKITKPLYSYHRHNEGVKVDELIKKIEEGNNVAVVSDAGTPVISDPGEVAVKEALKNGIEVIPIPGACALINALIASGLNTKEFCFLGFLPLNKKNRKDVLENIKNESKTIILYEAPHKLINTLKDLNSILEERQIVIARELTKIHEEFIRGTVVEILDKYKEPKGEHVIIIEGNNNIKNSTIDIFEQMDENQLFNYYKNKGLSKNEIIKNIAKIKKVHKNDIYKKFINK